MLLFHRVLLLSAPQDEIIDLDTVQLQGATAAADDAEVRLCVLAGLAACCTGSWGVTD